MIASVEYTIATKELTDPTIEIASGSVYDGNAKTPNVTVKDGENTIDPSEYTVSYDNNVNAGENTATVTITDNANGNYTVWYKVAGDGNYSDTTPESVGVTIAKAKVEIPAADPTQFTYSGEEQTYTLAASGLYTVAGNVRKSAGENYEITYVEGKLTLSVRPITSPTTTKTETTTNPNGSVTKTETKPDGTVTEITTNKDGSTTKSETKPDGSSKTEVKDVSGSIGTVKTDKHGQTTAETTLSSKAVEDAKRNGEPVTAPVEVEASHNSNTAPTVKVELPKNAGETEEEIPVSNVRPGTVAVLVHPDGTEEIVKNSLPTEDGIRLTMGGGATVKIMDNSKDFIDTRAHWAKDAIDFVSARGLVNGIRDTIYAPNNSTTRAQLWTILARQNDADLTGGSIWYEKAQNWAKDKGISDGADPNAAITRGQIATFLYNHTARQGAL